MYKVYADLIVKGIKVIKDVPEIIREDVRNELARRGLTEDGKEIVVGSEA